MCAPFRLLGTLEDKSSVDSEQTAFGTHLQMCSQSIWGLHPTIERDIALRKKLINRKYHTIRIAVPMEIQPQPLLLAGLQ